MPRFNSNIAHNLFTPLSFYKMKQFILPLLALVFTGLGVCISGCSNAQQTEANPEINASQVVVDNIMARRSIRKYKDQPVPQEILDKIVECGINAPNGMNQQCYEVKVVNDPASAAFLAENLNGLYKAPVYMFIAAKNNYDMSRIDVGLLAENVCLSAWAYGVGSINLGMPVRALYEKPELLAKLGFSEGHDLCLVLALGYADEAPDAKPRVAERVQYITIAE